MNKYQNKSNSDLLRKPEPHTILVNYDMDFALTS